MLAGVRSRFLLSFLLLAFSVCGCSVVQAQVNGVPPSVTSFGFGGRTIPTPGVRASVTSLGPNGYGNSWLYFGNGANFFLPPNPNPPFSGRHHRRREGDRDRNNNNKDHADFPIGIFEPAYVPYAVPYAQEADDDSPDFDYLSASGQQDGYLPTKRGGRVLASKTNTSAKSPLEEPVPAESEEPVATQPSTLLVFKDGHRSEVLNYAIVGDTLFDFAEGRSRKILLADLDLPATRRANDDRGVDFQIPANTARR
jgi:hypothetical protein